MSSTDTTAGNDLLDRMVAARQLSAMDADSLRRLSASGRGPAAGNEEEVLRWLAAEYRLDFTPLDDVEPDKQVLSLFPARILLRDELLPLRRVNGHIEVATSRLFDTQGLDTLKTMRTRRTPTWMMPPRMRRSSGL